MYVEGGVSIILKQAGCIFVVASMAVFISLISPGVTALAATVSDSGLKVVGNQVITPSGQAYVPEGISVYGGLEAPDYDENIPNDDAQIRAAAEYWHANTIRLQVAESNMFNRRKKGEPYNQKFLRALVQQVNLAHSLGTAVVINDQTEFTSNRPAPTDETAHFWKIISQRFKNQPYVIFDLFNEPRLTNTSTTNTQLTPEVLYSLFGYSEITQHGQGHEKQPRGNGMSQAKSWSLWRNGGRLNGTNYLGMQTLVNQIRRSGAQNLIWIEGKNEAQQLPPNQYLIHGSNIAYSIHHPNLNNPASWSRIGNLAATQPVVEGEWAQYQSTWAECYSDAYTNAPLYLNYLHAHNIGVIACSLQANSLLQGDNRVKPTNTNRPYDPKLASRLKTPDRLLPNYSCTNKSGQGVGQLLQTYFANNSVHYTL
jgi:hypothetical protein